MISDERKVEIDQLDTKILIEGAMLTQDRAAMYYDELRFMKFTLLKRMLKDGGSVIPHPTIECKGKKDNTSWDYALLKPILEELDDKISADEMKLFYIPEHEEVIIVKEKFDMRVGKGFMKFGGKVKQIIENATIEGFIKDITLSHKE